MSDATRPVKPSNEWTVGDLRRILDACPDDAVLFVEELDNYGRSAPILLTSVLAEHSVVGVVNVIFTGTR